LHFPHDASQALWLAQLVVLLLPQIELLLVQLLPPRVVRWLLPHALAHQDVGKQQGHWRLGQMP